MYVFQLFSVHIDFRRNSSHLSLPPFVHHHRLELVNCSREQNARSGSAKCETSAAYSVCTLLYHNESASLDRKYARYIITCCRNSLARCLKPYDASQDVVERLMASTRRRGSEWIIKCSTMQLFSRDGGLWERCGNGTEAPGNRLGKVLPNGITQDWTCAL